MSLSTQLSVQVENIIGEFIEKVASKFELEKDELQSLWKSEDGKNGKSSVAELTQMDMEDLSPARLAKCNKAELSALCKSKAVKSTGTKDELINRLMGDAQPEKGEKAEKGTKGTKTVKATKAKAPVAKKGATKSSVIAKIKKGIAPVAILKNTHGNYEHPETRLVFDNKNQTVVGKQEDAGTVSDLTDDDIQSCKKFKFEYKIPNNLDKKLDLNQIKVEGLEEEEEEEKSDGEKEEPDEMDIDLDSEGEIEL